MVFCFVFFRTTRELEYLLFLSRKARNFFSEFHIRLYDKNSESYYFFFLHQNQNIFFSNIGNQNIFNNLWWTTWFIHLLGCVYTLPENSLYSSINAFLDIEIELVNFIEKDMKCALVGDFNAKTVFFWRFFQNQMKLFWMLWM